jgi:alkylmercury lyase
MNDDLAERIRWAAFDRVRAKMPTTAVELAAELETPLADVGNVLDAQAAVGRIELDAAGSVVGSLGLTLSTTKHTLEVDGTELHTWCALDALGIPVASAASGRVITSCGWCGRSLTVAIEAGVPEENDQMALWLPTGPCDNDMREQFCSVANLFCESDHLEQW